MKELAQLGASIGLAAAAFGLAPQPARACSGGCASDLFWVNPSLPVNGALIAGYSCQWGSACTPPESLEITDAHTAARIAGDLEVQPVHGAEGNSNGSDGARYIFRPEQPFEEGATYRVKIRETEGAQGFLDTEHLVEATAAADLTNAEGISTEIALNVLTVGIGERTCCEEGPSGAAGVSHCYSPRAAVVLEPVPLVEGPNAGQWLAHVRLLDESGNPKGEVLESGEVLTETQDEYCFEIELESAIDGRLIPKGTACTPSDGTQLEETTLECNSGAAEADAEGKDAGGCSARPGAPLGSPAWMLASIFALIALRHRRR